ncbi:MAG: DUF2330 domain-containing protein [Myxococcota bacterium]|nr:DUF2330 domain-containing protein [Myxococcota bacterium]
MLLSLLIQPAFPCAGLFHSSDVIAESDNQQVLLRQLDGEIEVSYNVEYEGNAIDFGWVIPVFGEFSAMEDGDEQHFTTLGYDTAPVVSSRYADDDGGCGQRTKGSSDFADEANRLDTAAMDGAEIVAEGFTGTYSYTVLEADSVDGLEGWLTDNGWSMESSRPVLEAYVAEGGVQFVAISLTGGEDTDAAMLPPVSIRYTGDQLRFPATMARYAMVETLRTTVYVMGEQPATVSGWSSTTNTDIEADINRSVDAVFDDALWAAGGDTPGYLLTYAGSHGADLPEGVVTRFDTFSSRDAHTIDAQFALDGTDEVVTSISMVEDGADTKAWLLLPLLAGCGVWRRRREGATG